MIPEFCWRAVAKVVSQPRVVDWLITRAEKTPYTDIYNGGDLYMRRLWLFNPYNLEHKPGLWRRFMSHLPSVRLHHIVKADDARDHHDHPWEARTIILHNGYTEVRLEKQEGAPEGLIERTYDRRPGDTAAIHFNQYHTITEVYGTGAWTMFITWKYQGTWGFLVNGKKMPWREYLGVK